jgi:DNA-binding transcriptional LysR family regulator
MDGLTLDQIQLFLAVVDAGSFSKAAEKLNRAQSAVTYGIQKLEAQVGLLLFDRETYRPSLTEAGVALLSRARRVAEEANGFREFAKSLASGLEADLPIVLDAMFPMPPFAEALRAFSQRFPTVPPRIYVQSLGAAAELLLGGACVIGLLPLLFGDIARFKRFPLMTVDLIPVVAPSHPLAGIDGPIETNVLNRHVQLVLTDRSTMTAGRDFGVLSRQTWRLADLSAKHSMLLAGLGWGKMPAHLIKEDIVHGQLKVIQPVEFDARASNVVMSGAYLAGRPLGPAGQWMIRHLSGSIGS